MGTQHGAWCEVRAQPAPAQASRHWSLACAPDNLGPGLSWRTWDLPSFASAHWMAQDKSESHKTPGPSSSVLQLLKVSTKQDDPLAGWRNRGRVVKADVSQEVTLQ